MTPRPPRTSASSAPEASAEPIRAADAAAATTGRSVLGGGTWNVLSQMLPQVYLLLISIVAARFLGPDKMGRQSFIAFVELSVVMLLSEGLAISLSRYVSETLGRREPERLRDLVSWAWRVEAIAALAGGLALLVVALSGADPAAAWVLAAVGTSVGIMQTIPNAVLVGAQRWREASIVGLVTGTIGLPLTILVLAAGGGIVGLFAVEAVVVTANLLWTSRLAGVALRDVSRRRAEARDLRRRTLRYALWTSFGVILSFIVFRRSEFFFLDHYSTDSQIALYSIAFAAFNALIMLPQALAGAVLPAFATLFGAGALSRMQSGYSRSLRLASVATLPITAGVIALGPEALRLVYGDDYSGTGAVLLVMVAALPLIPLMAISQAMLGGLEKVAAPTAIAAVAAAVNIVLAFVLIPSYDAVGAGLANTGAQAAAAMAVVVYSWRTLGDVRLEVPSLLRAGLASGAGGAAAWGVLSALGGVVGLAAGLVAGIAVFSGVGAAIGILPADDAAWLRTTAGPRLGTWFERGCSLFARPAAVGTERP